MHICLYFQGPRRILFEVSFCLSKDTLSVFECSESIYKRSCCKDDDKVWYHLRITGINIKEAFRKAFNATPYLECTVSSVSGDPYDVGQDLLPLTSRWECCVYCHFSLSISLEAEPFSRHPSV